LDISPIKHDEIFTEYLKKGLWFFWLFWFFWFIWFLGFVGYFGLADLGPPGVAIYRASSTWPSKTPSKIGTFVKNFERNYNLSVQIVKITR